MILPHKPVTRDGATVKPIAVKTVLGLDVEYTYQQQQQLIIRNFLFLPHVEPERRGPTGIPTLSVRGPVLAVLGPWHLPSRDGGSQPEAELNRKV